MDAQLLHLAVLGQSCIPVSRANRGLKKGLLTQASAALRLNRQNPWVIPVEKSAYLLRVHVHRARRILLLSTITPGRQGTSCMCVQCVVLASPAGSPNTHEEYHNA